MSKSHAHCPNTRPDTTIVRNLITKNGTFCSIHDEPNIALDTTGFDISFIGSKSITSLIIEGINKGFDTDRGSFTVVYGLSYELKCDYNADIGA